MTRLGIALVAAGCAASPPSVDGTTRSATSDVALRATAPSTTTPRWSFPATNVQHAAAMVRGIAVVEDMIRRALKAYEGGSACPNSAPIPSTLPTRTSIALADPYSFRKDPGFHCIGFDPTSELEFQLTFSSAPPFKKPRREASDPILQACAEADLVPGGRSTLVCFSAFADPTTGEPTIADRADVDLEPFEPDESPMPEAPRDATVTSVCERLARIHSPRVCETDLRKKQEKHPEDFACFAGCSTLAHVDDQAYCVERCILAKMSGPTRK